MNEHAPHHEHPLQAHDPDPASPASADSTPMAGRSSHPSTELAVSPATAGGHGRGVWTEERIRALGAVTDLPTAARIFGLGRALAYELAKHGRFPVPVIRVGTRYRVPVAPILTALHLSPADDLTTSAQRSVDHHDGISSTGPQHMDPDPRRGNP